MAESNSGSVMLLIVIGIREVGPYLELVPKQEDSGIVNRS